MAESKHILISGAGIAGPALGLLLTRNGHRCTIVERAPDFRSSGQQIDISGEALKVVQHMGLEDEIKAHTVHDDGIKFVGAENKAAATFPVSTAAGLVKEIEIMRPELARIFMDRTKGGVEYVFGESISRLEQGEERVRVTFAKSGATRDFDIVVGADGLRSKTRGLAFDASNTEIVPLGQYASFFSVPWRETDSSWSRWYNAPEGRTVCLRPNIDTKITGAYLCQISKDSGKVAGLSFEEQKQLLLDVFSDAGWETQRVLDELKGLSPESFYLQEIAQAKTKSLVSGRVVLLGDAGYCPSPITGQGTTLALIGAHILAGCIVSHKDTPESLKEYERQIRPFVETLQKLPPGAPQIVNPQTTSGIWILNKVLGVADAALNSGLVSKLQEVAQPVVEKLIGGLTLPDYPALKSG